MKLKHNKKRNTAFLYETLIKELTKSIINKNSDKKHTILEILKTHFSKDTLLYKELELYRSLYDSSGINPYLAERIIFETKREYEKIDKKSLFLEQSNLINRINKELPKSVYLNFVRNYKDLASIQQIFNAAMPVKTRVLLETNLINTISSRREEEKEMMPIDNITYSTFISKFNEKYGHILFEEQKELLSRYIASFSDNGLSLKMFLNEEIGRLKEEVKDSLTDKEVKKEETIVEKLKEVLGILQSYAKKELVVEEFQKILKIQNLIREIKK
tara:strand:+ start:3011 stop:3829 length:819 start_codon:yes stop_codon:yes gene_type:complete